MYQLYIVEVFHETMKVNIVTFGNLIDAEHARANLETQRGPLGTFRTVTRLYKP